MSTLLTHRQSTFVSSYIALGGNGVKAAKQAGYRGSDDYLAVQASRMIRNDKVQEAIQETVAPTLEKLNITAERTLKELADIAYSPWRDHVTIRMTKDMKIKVKMQLNNKLKALIQISKILDMYPKKDGNQEYCSNVNFENHQNYTPDEARRNLLNYLRQQR